MELRKHIIAGNWKMYKTTTEVVAWAEKFNLGSFRRDDIEMVVFAPFTVLHVLNGFSRTGRFGVGAQDLYPGTFGAFTGEVSGPMLRDAGVQWVLVGHSERRSLFGEDHRFLAAKLRSALEFGLRPVYCVGETLQQRENQTHLDTVATQVKEVLAGLDEEQAASVVVAYEPVWAIGTGRTATVAQAEEMHAFIRETLTLLFGSVSQAIPILYGGSVKASNARELFQSPNIDGALVGGASLDPQEFQAIAASC